MWWRARLSGARGDCRRFNFCGRITHSTSSSCLNRALCSDLVADTEANVVGGLLGAEALGVEGLVALDLPVVVDLVGHGLVVHPVLAGGPGVAQAGALGEVVLAAAHEGDGGAHEALGVLAVVEDALVGVGEAVVLDGAAGAGGLGDLVDAGEVLGVLVVEDDLAVLLGELALLVLASDADVPVVVVQVQLEDGAPLGGLVVLKLDLHSVRIHSCQWPGGR